MPRSATAFLDDPLLDVQDNRHGPTAMTTYSNPITGWKNWPGGRAALHGVSGNIPAVSELNAKRLLSVLAYRASHTNPALFNTALKNGGMNPLTVKEFRQLSQAQQLNFIDGLWNAATTQHPFTVLAERMYDPQGSKPNSDKAPFPTSWRPNDTKGLKGSPWKKFAIGFRVDGADQSSINRVLQHGMTQQRLNSWFMQNFRGLEISNTAAAISSHARCWTGNNDIFNETAVCVSRNFFGATAFPNRDTISKPGQACYLWAVNCYGLMGFDTEQYQLNLANSRNWRPGEKAFRFIPKERVLGYVPVKKLGRPKGGWSFSIDKNASWTFTNAINFPQREYINEELKAWKGKHDIPGTHDFANV